MSINKSCLFLLLLTALLGTNCNLQQIARDRGDTLGWQTLSSSIERRVTDTELDENQVQYVLYRFKPDSMRASLHHSTSPKRIEAWQRQTDANLVLNGGYFTEEFEPTGYTVKNGEVIGSRAYDDKSTGFVVIDNGSISLDFTITPPNFDDSTSLVQSFPILIRDGKPEIEEDSSKIARRTIVAEDNQEHFYIVVFERTPVSLHQAMRVLINDRTDFTNALNLDGGPSTALMAKFVGFEEQFVPLSPLPQVISLQETHQDQSRDRQN